MNSKPLIASSIESSLGIGILRDAEVEVPLPVCGSGACRLLLRVGTCGTTNISQHDRRPWSPPFYVHTGSPSSSSSNLCIVVLGFAFRTVVVVAVGGEVEVRSSFSHALGSRVGN